MSDTLTDAAAAFAAISPGVPCPEPGIYPDIPAETYHRWDACSNSRCTDLADTPAYCRYRIDNPKKRDEGVNDPLMLGTMLHVALLEPEQFEAKYGQLTEWTGSWTKIAMAAAEKIEATGRIVLVPKHWQMAEMARESAWENAATRAVLERATERELSCVFDMDLDGGIELRSKMRIDFLSEGGFVVDAKSKHAATRHAIEAAIAEYGYHRQAAMYLDGMAALGKPQKHFLILAIDKRVPHKCALYRIEDEAVEAGRTELHRLATEYHVCQSTGEWPGHPQTIQTIGVPRWAYERAYGKEV